MNKLVILLLCILVILPAQGLEYDFSSVQSITIELSPQKEYYTKDGIIEGEKFPLIILGDVYHNEKCIAKKGDTAYGRIGTVITAGMNGFPAEILIDDIEIAGIDSSQLMYNYSKIGQNRCLWVYPLKWALTPLPPTGSLTNFIFGGHAKLKTSDIIKVNYYPNWK